ncbi:MAG: hypothetical protein O2890_09815 [Cyanobacteria bacterium]|nr:hypothetical protein [Cyanobacteriota bacterium]MDA0866699.1 hypothetical protein [Cyanobacteriota bacterium]
MGFPVPCNAFEQRLDLNHRLVHNPAATFFMRVDSTVKTSTDIHPGDRSAQR